MESTTNKRKERIYQDHNGNEIPSRFIHKTDRDKDAAARKFHKEAVKLSEKMVEFKKEMLAKCDELYNRVLTENRVTIRENAKGGFSIITIDKSIKIEISISETIHFDEKIDIAQAKIKEYLQEVTHGISNDLQLLINQAFQTTRGHLDTKRVLGLLKLNITHIKWKEAMELITKSMQSNNTKRYIRIWERDTNGQYQAIRLDFASL